MPEITYGSVCSGIEQDREIYGTAAERINEAIAIRDTPVPQSDLFATA
ncbi:hypothetical protein [Pseudomonas fluorescens]|nr:hypothetical protein [Pseudomonas fluorescens]